MFALVSRRRAVALEAENRRLRNRVRAYEHAAADTAHTVYRYERRLTRLCRAVAEARREYAVQCRVADRLSDRLLDATGYLGEPLNDSARKVLGLLHDEVKP